jgi:S-(hydroxymethyl)glutathione dehydrogenase/alcohol dehydrogenase
VGSENRLLSRRCLTGSHGGDARPDIDIPRIIRLIPTGWLSLDGLITHEYQLDEINTALDVVRRGAARRVLLHLADA